MKALSLLLVFCLSGCGHLLVRDLNEASIDQGFKRVETIICDRHDVGENGCIFKDGEQLGELKIFVINSGSVDLIGCGGTSALRYEKTGWLSVALSEIVSDESDCSLDIFLKPDYPGQNSAQFPVRGMYGTVTIGRCPAGVICSFESTQQRLSKVAVWNVSVDDSGAYLVRSCGQEMGRGDFNETLSLDLLSQVPEHRRKAKDGCAIILSLKGWLRHKLYHKVWFYDENVIPVQIPALKFGDKISFVSDKSVTVTVVNNKIYGQKGKFKPSQDGDFLRFYTSQGRSLVVFVKDGEIKWSK